MSIPRAINAKRGLNTQMNRIYVTHCSAKKDQTLKLSKLKVKPIELYTSTPIRRFMKTCENKEVNWAIFSDKYAISHSNQKHEWYEKIRIRVMNRNLTNY